MRMLFLIAWSTIAMAAELESVDTMAVTIGVDPTPKQMRVTVATSDADYDVNGTTSENLRVALRVIGDLDDFEALCPIGGFALSYGHYAVEEADLNAFDGQFLFGGRFRPATWISLDALVGLGLGYEVLTVPLYTGQRGDYLLWGLNGEALLRLAVRPVRGMEVALEGGYWGLYTAWDATPQLAEATVSGPTLGGAVGLTWDW